MVIKFFNTLSRKKEEFVPVNKELVRLYTCGPTVYNFAHIGNFRTYIFEDILRRWLKYRGFNVKQVMNLTDVDDKTIRDSQKEGVSLLEFTQRYGDAFFEDIDALNIERAEEYPKATDHVAEMVFMIEVLLEKGLAYKADDGSVYFSINKFKSYGELAHIDVEKLKSGASGRVKSDEYEKENVADFALWKAWDESDGDVAWETQLGKGRPGWHIECSAMSARHLSDIFHGDHVHLDAFETIDIHTGGVDNIFPHHQDEIAQSEGVFGVPFVKYWMHSEHLLVDGKKMSKSLGNFFTLRDILAKGYDARVVRYLLLSVHYRQQLNFTFASLDASAAAVSRLNDFVRRLSECKTSGDDAVAKQLVASLLRDFESTLDDDLEMSRALAAVFTFMNEVNRLIDSNSLSSSGASVVRDAMLKVDSVLGVLKDEAPLSAELQSLVDARIKARSEKNWKRSDELRDELLKNGIVVEDSPNGQRWKRVL